MRFYREIEITRYSVKGNEKLKDIVVEEYPLNLFVNGQEMATLLCSPLDLEFLSVGFLASAGLIESARDIKEVNILEEEGIAEIELYKQINLSKGTNESHTITTSSTGGSRFYNIKEALDVFASNGDETNIDYGTIIELAQKFDNRCTIFKQTGGAHACAFATNEDIVIFHEDIGRHNAMDKVIGHCIMEDIDFEKGFVLTSGRISSEMLVKAAKRRIPIYISRSAPTALAVEISQKTNILLIGFTRGKRFNVYNGVSRIINK